MMSSAQKYIQVGDSKHSPISGSEHTPPGPQTLGEGSELSFEVGLISGS